MATAAKRRPPVRPRSGGFYAGGPNPLRDRAERAAARREAGYTPKSALQRAGIRIASEGGRETRAAGRQARAAGRVLDRAGALPELGVTRTSWGGLILFTFASIIGLAILDAALGGRGPAGAERLLGFFGTGIKKVVDPHDTILARSEATGLTLSGVAATSTGGAESSRGGLGASAGKTGATGLGILGRLGKLIGLPGQGTHSFTSGPNNWQSDNAIDLGVEVGTPVYARRAGVIDASRYGPLNSSDPHMAGLRLTLVSPDNERYYAHLSRVVVRPGQRVEAGQLIGYTGSANGVAHLHYAIKNGNPLADANQPRAVPATR